MSNKYAWTLIAIVALPGIAWLIVSLISDPEAEELAKQPAGANGVSPLVAQAMELVSAKPAILRNDGYVGSDSCQSCHEDQHQSWHASYHRTMTQAVTPATVLPAAIMEGGTVKVQGQTYKFSRQGDDFFVELNDPIVDGNG